MKILLILFGMQTVSQTFAQEKIDEVEVKASIIASFIAFTSWPKKPSITNDVQFQLCIVGENPYSKIFKTAQESGIQGRTLVIKTFQEKVSDDGLKACHILVIKLENRKKTTRLLKRVSNLPILTISELNGYKDQASMINISRKKNQIVFSVNRTLSDRVGIKFRSKLLRLAEKVMGDEQ